MHVERHFWSVGPLRAAHRISGIIAFPSSIPSSVSEYSTRGGISAKDCRVISFSACRSLSVSERVFGLMPPSSFMRSVNLSLPLLQSPLMIRSAHFLLMTSMTPSMGQKHRWLHCLGMFCYFLWG